MWWKIMLMVLVMMAVCFVGGVYAGGALFLKLTGSPVSGLTWNTLWDARHLPFTDRRLLFLPWSWCATAALTFLPVCLTLVALWTRLKPRTSLHGDARFANARELKQFEYRGDYVNTSKK